LETKTVLFIVGGVAAGLLSLSCLACIGFAIILPGADDASAAAPRSGPALAEHFAGLEEEMGRTICEAGGGDCDLLPSDPGGLRLACVMALRQSDPTGVDAVMGCIAPAQETLTRCIDDEGVFGSDSCTTNYETALGPCVEAHPQHYEALIDCQYAHLLE